VVVWRPCIRDTHLFEEEAAKLLLQLGDDRSSDPCS